MEQSRSSPPKTDYAEKKDLLQDLYDLREKMRTHEFVYNRKEKLVENLQVVEHRRSYIVGIFILSVVLRIALTEDTSIIYVSRLTNLPVKTNVLMTLGIVVGIPLLYYVVFKLLTRHKIRSYRKSIDECDSELKEIYDSYGVCPVGYRYTMPKVVDQIIDMILDGRADTVKEAVNLIVSDEQTAKLLDYQDSIARSGKQTAAATTVTAFFSWRNAHWAKRSSKKLDDK